MTAPEPRFWVNTVSLDHVEGAVAGGFTQADHGANTRLRRLGVGDGVVFYSPRTEMGRGDPVQQFTAIGIVTGEEPYQVTMSEDFHPWRRAMEFPPCVRVDVKPLAAELSFIHDPTHWGLPFRRGLFEIPASDYRFIVSLMRA